MSASSPSPSLAPAQARTQPGWDAHVHVFEAGAPVRAGHYQPVHRPLAEIEASAAAHGIGHLVLVQPSVYGSDHAVLLRALEGAAGRHRGIAVVEPSVDEAELDRLAAAGVRGIRFNLVSPAGHAGDPAASLRALAPRMRARGWHVQWYVAPHWLPALARWQRETGLVFVLDHLAGLGTGVPGTPGALVPGAPSDGPGPGPDDPAWAAARDLADQGAWLKLSGWYRLGAAAPYDALHPAIVRLAGWFGPRLVWGSDWPHTSFAPDALPGYGSLLQPVRAALGEAALQQILEDNPQRLYG